MVVKVNALDHIVINVADVARSAQWYQKVLGMEIGVFDPGPGQTPRTSLMFGNQKINVRPRDADKVEWFTADHETAGSDDLCFLTSLRHCDRDRGEPHGSSPPTPPYVRVRIRRFDELNSIWYRDSCKPE